ncbi:GNAT family N-acetyltransferase [Phytomonospora sp. NPDC050363]|uniref:GNAT family N-acetyltransferase n=1 Tax=Phytomonospora sp. NPDC050363 TaxID=3155642 RepID=UPI0033FCFCF2
MSDVRVVDPHDEIALRAWYTAMRAGAAADRVHPLIQAYEEFATSLRTPNPSRRRTAYAAYGADGTVLGTLDLALPLKENLRLAEWDVNVPPEYRRRGVGTALFEFGHRLATAEGRTVHSAEVNIPQDQGPERFAGSLFARRLGFTTEHQEDRLILELPVADDALAAIKERSAGSHSGYSFVGWTRACPDEHVEAFALMRTTMSDEVPTGTLDHEPIVWDVERLRLSESRLAASGMVSITTAARAADGAFAGYSLMYAPEHNPDEVYQDDTLVIDAHRGHRLGAAMKARNLEILQAGHPGRSRVHTWTAGSNAPMRHVNASFGFRAVELMHEMQRTDA